MNDWRAIAVTSCLLLVFGACSTGDAAREDGDGTEQTKVVAVPGECGQCVAVPEGPREVLFDPEVKQAKLYFEDAGNVTKYVAYVDAQALPAWVLQMADEKLGPGEDLEWEIEYYGDDRQVYEVTRRTEEGVRVMSVGSDRTIYYLDYVIDAAELPRAVSQRVEQFAGLQIDAAARKEYRDGSVRYLVQGMFHGGRHRLLLSEEGELISHHRTVPAVIEVPVHSPE